MSLVSQRRSTLNPNAPLFVPAAVRQVEDFSPEWWELVTTSTWFHDYWLNQQQQGGDGFFGNTTDNYDIVDMLPDSIDTDEDMLSMEAQYEEFLHSSSMETMSAFGSHGYKQMYTSNGLETEGEKLIRSLNLSSNSTHGSHVEMARYAERPVKTFSPRIGSQRIQQPR